MIFRWLFGNESKNECNTSGCETVDLVADTRVLIIQLLAGQNIAGEICGRFELLRARIVRIAYERYVWAVRIERIWY